MATTVLDITATPGADEPPARGGGKPKLAPRDPMAPRGWAAFVQYALLVIAGLIALFPFYAMLVMSLRAPGVALSFPGSLVPADLTFEHYEEIWATGKM